MLRRSGLSVAPRFLWECLNSRTVSLVSNPRRIERSVRICRTPLSCCLRIEG